MAWGDLPKEALAFNIDFLGGDEHDPKDEVNSHDLSSILGE